MAEIMIGSTLGSIVLAGVLSTFLMLGRSGTNVVSYTMMDAQTRKALEEFAQDIRMASAISWNSPSSITLTVPDNYAADSNRVTYSWDTTAGSATYHTFYRNAGDGASANPRSIYVRNVTSLTYYRYDRLNAEAATDLATKRIQLRMTITTRNSTVADATDTTLSASFVLRNKPTN